MSTEKFEKIREINTALKDLLEIPKTALEVVVILRQNKWPEIRVTMSGPESEVLKTLKAAENE
jgi:hypothetical protein